MISAQERARQLSANTTVPTPFKVAYEIYTDDCEKIEKEIHVKLDEKKLEFCVLFSKWILSEELQYE